jgi:Ni/Fe-hydrogenase subunit HybB-like protein
MHSFNYYIKKNHSNSHRGVIFDPVSQNFPTFIALFYSAITGKTPVPILASPRTKLASRYNYSSKSVITDVISAKSGTASRGFLA